jgi:hypothetical protein
MVFTNVTMQSEKFVCVRETGTTNNVVIVDMANPSAPTRRPITADSTILAPSSKILALKAAASADGSSPGDNLQVFNLETKQKLKAYLNPTKVQFWTWLNDKTIGVVTENAVFHWHLEVRSAILPTYFFNRALVLTSGCNAPRYCRAQKPPKSILIGPPTSMELRLSATAPRLTENGVRWWALRLGLVKSAPLFVVNLVSFGVRNTFMLCKWSDH